MIMLLSPGSTTSTGLSGEPITDSVAKKRWLYLGGRNAIKCDRASEVAACVASMSMNMGVGSEKTDSNIVAFIQQKILWYMYYEGLLDNYPTCIALLGKTINS